MTCPPRYATPRTESRQTLGDTAARIALALGTTLMPWQRQVLDTALEMDDSGLLVYRDVVLTVPRQSGKTTIALALILLRALSSPRQNIRYTAQTGSDARKKWFDDWLPVLDASPLKRHFTSRLANGHEALLFRNGSIQSLVSTTSKSGHGASIDLAILDEAFAHTDARLEQALRPAMITRPEPQLWVISTAGTPTGAPYLRQKVENGRQLAAAGVTEGTAYFEWSAEDDADPGDPATWRSCMPALNITAGESAVAADYRAMDVSEFARAYLNRWVVSMVDPVIPLDTWNSLIDPASAPSGSIALAFDVTPDRSRTTIAAAGKRADGLSHVEVAAHGAGTGWVVERVVEMSRKHRPSGIYCDATGPAGSLMAEIEREGVEVTAISGKEHAQACGLSYDAAVQNTVRHRGDEFLSAALDGAVKRSLGDAWAWSRRSSAVDISPLVSCTIAHWAAANAPERSIGLWDLNEIVAQMRAEGKLPDNNPQAAAPPAPKPAPGVHPNSVNIFDAPPGATNWFNP